MSSETFVHEGIFNILIGEHAAIAVGVPFRKPEGVQESFGQFFLHEAARALHQIVILLKRWIETRQNTGDSDLRLDEQCEVETQDVAFLR